MGLDVGPGAPAINTLNAFYFTGRSDNHGTGNSLDPANVRLDPEGIGMSNDGVTIYVSNEYGPYVRAFDAATGEIAIDTPPPPRSSGRTTPRAATPTAAWRA